MKDELESRISDLPNLGIDGSEMDDQPIKIAMIFFAFDNKKMIEWLRVRGENIKNERWEQVQNINQQISSALVDDSALVDKLQRPCSVFVTFESEEGYHRALTYNNLVASDPNYQRYRTLLGQEIEI